MVKNYNEILYDNKIINTQNLILRKFKKEDAADVFEYSSDFEVLEFLPWDGYKSVEEAKEDIISTYWSIPNYYAIELNSKIIGCIDINLKTEHEKAGFGYMINRKYWGKGYMTEALSAVLGILFEKVELNRVESTHYAGNEASGRVMIKCGMKFEGIGKQEEKIKGTFRDVLHYGITKEQWDGLKCEVHP